MEDKETVQQEENTPASTPNNPADEENKDWKHKITHIDNFRRNLIFTLWGGAGIGAATGYVVSVLKGAPIQLYMTTMTVTFGVGSMVFYGSYHYLEKGMGNTVWTWMISGAATGIVGGLISNPRYLPVTTLCFTGLGAAGFFGYKMLNRYYNLKQLKLKEAKGIITDEEREKMKAMKTIKKPNMPKWFSKIEK